MTQDTLFGISAAIATPFDENGAIDVDRLAAHSLNLLESGCSSLTYFGTTGEGPSLSMEERAQTVSAMVKAGVPGDKINLAIIVSSLGDALKEARHGIANGCAALLVAPPYYFKQPDDEGLFQWFSDFISALGSDCPKIILYHIPQVTAAPLSIALVQRLKDAFPAQVYGVKDSSGDWDNGEKLLGLDNIAVMLGDERLLAKASSLGGQGMISGVANFQAQALRQVLDTGLSNPALDALVDTLVSYPVIPAVKVALAATLGDTAWARVRAPLPTLDKKTVDAIVGQLDGLHDR